MYYEIPARTALASGGTQAQWLMQWLMQLLMPMADATADATADALCRFVEI
jgi:hypothetical protein